MLKFRIDDFFEEGLFARYLAFFLIQPLHSQTISIPDTLNGLKKMDIYWSNELLREINEKVNTFQFDLKYDNYFSGEVQMKEVQSAGVSLKLY